GMAALASPKADTDALANVAVWNPLPWQRKCVCEVDLLFRSDYPAKALRSGHTGPVVNQFELRDANDRAMPFQVLRVEQKRKVKGVGARGRRQSLGKEVDVYRVAVPLDLPAAGHTGLTVRPLEGVGAVRRQLGSLRRGPLEAENEHLAVKVTDDGTVELTGKADGRVYRDLFRYQDSGDAGDGWNFVPPIANPTVVSPGRTAQVCVEQDGPLQVTFRIDRVLRVPAGLDPVQRERRCDEQVDVRIVDRLTLRAGDGVLEVRTEVSNTARDHRLQVLFASGIAGESYWADQPFAWVQRPVATASGSAHYKEPDPVERPHHSVFAIADGDRGGLAVLCPEGLHEHCVYDDDARTLGLTLFRSVGATPQTDGEPGPQVLGDLSFRYGLHPFGGALPRAALLRRVAEMQAGVATHLSAAAPGARSFLQVTGSDDVLATALKPAADGRSVVLRLWNPSDEDAEVRVQTANRQAAASLCDLKEDDLQALSPSSEGVRVAVAARSLACVRLVAE
ncbi:MAG: glycoside hydrolase family 38 C-terminal domain-containing protein, partial [Planctomycetota bacterium]